MMANPEHLSIIRQGVKSWNQWREETQRSDDSLIAGDLSGADLRKLDLSSANFKGSDLTGADLREADVAGANFEGAVLAGANLYKLDLHTATLKQAILDNADLTAANLTGLDLSGIMTHLESTRLMLANLTGANLSGAMLEKADLTRAFLDGANFDAAFATGANLSHVELRGPVTFVRAYLSDVDFSGADLTNADLSYADLSRSYFIDATLAGANLQGANLRKAVFVRTDLTNANLEGCKVFGIAAWALSLTGAKQSKLVITDDDEPVVEVDDLGVAQFIYLLLNNQRIRDVIDTIGQKAILILGRFSPERKEILDAIADGLRQRGYVPLMFDFEKSRERDITETIKILAGLSLFIIADITNPRSNPLELQATVPDYMIPLVPIIHEGDAPFAMFVDLQQKYPWVLEVLRYDTKEGLLEALGAAVIAPALKKHDELTTMRTRAIRTKSVRDYLPKPGTET
jgi:uncharacterized protein YjbI with pentapeptide repeats